MSDEEIQSIMNSTFGGLAFFCRDADLDDNLIAKYQPNQILLERGFTDVSHKIGGIEKNCRYLIASSQGKDLSMFSPNPEFGHIMIQSGSYFKVLDIQQQNNKTQILLLNIPEEGVEMFKNSKINIEDQLVEKAVEIFKRSIETAPLKELQSSDWVERTSFPIGMNQKGVFFMENATSTGLDSSKEVKLNKEQDGQTDNGPSESKGMNAIISKPDVKKKGFWSKLFGK